MISGTRKDPPISTSSPREMATFFPGGQGGEHQEYGRGVVVHRQGGFRPGEGAEKPVHMGEAAAPAALFQVVFQIGVAPGGPSYTPARRPPPAGARPRLVWSTTPVALMTARRWGRQAPPGLLHGLNRQSVQTGQGLHAPVQNAPAQPVQLGPAASFRA